MTPKQFVTKIMTKTLKNQIEEAATEAGVIGMRVEPALVIRGWSVSCPARINTTYGVTSEKRSSIDISPAAFLTRAYQVRGIVEFFRAQQSKFEDCVRVHRDEIYNAG